MKYVRNSAGNLETYKFINEKEKIAFEVIKTQIDGRLSRLESNVNDIKETLNSFVIECRQNDTEIEIIKSGIGLMWKVFGAVSTVLLVIVGFLALAKGVR
jgi:hypothetical protein